jgi:hypothetical protein
MLGTETHYFTVQFKTSRKRRYSVLSTGEGAGLLIPKPNKLVGDSGTEEAQMLALDSETEESEEGNETEEGNESEGNEEIEQPDQIGGRCRL